MSHVLRGTRSWSGPLLIVALAVACSGPGDGGVSEAVPAVAARVDGDEITGSSVEEQYVVALKTFDGAKEVIAKPEGRATLRAQLLSGLIQLDVLGRVAAKRGLTVDLADLDTQRATLAAAAGGEAAYQKRIKGVPLTVVDLQLRQAALEDRMIQDLSHEVEVPSADVVGIYRTNKTTRFGPKVRARHILLDDARSASAVLDRLVAGEDFAQIARAESLDKATAAAGGDLGALQRGTTVGAVEKALFGGRVGDVVGPITTHDGVEILEITGRIEAQAFPAVRAQIRAELANAAARERLGDLVVEETADADVWVHASYGKWVPGTAQVAPPDEG